jgi:glycosyltransferase involved in cell wall biosynthesis
MEMRRAICVVSEDITMPLDEGIKIFAHSLLSSWRRDFRVIGVSAHTVENKRSGRVISARMNKLFLSLRFWALSWRFNPEVVCYVPSASATLYSFIRSRVLKYYWPNARIFMVSLQPRLYGWLERQLIRRLAPDAVFVQDETSLKNLQNLGCKTYLLPSGVDLQKFKPVTLTQKMELRRKYGLQPNAYTVLHVGHIKTERGIDLLSQVQQRNNVQMVLVGSSLPDGERDSLEQKLRKDGVVVIDKYLGDIQEIYQLADCYLFPVFSEHAAIGTPLSVLEAMACNLPVVTVRHGGLEGLFKAGDGLYYADTPEMLLETIGRIKGNDGCQTRSKVISCSWTNVAADILAKCEI